MSTPPYSNGPDSPQGYPQTPQGHPPPQGYPAQHGNAPQGYPPPQDQPPGYPPTHGHPGYPGAHNYAGGPGGPPPANSKTPLIIGGVVLLLALLAAGVFFSGGDDEPSYAASTPAAAPAPAPAPAAADPALAAAATPAPAAASAPAAATSRRYANSPGDGFLSLRSNPTVNAGSRVLQIPHGASVDVGSCDTADTVGGVSGRWCSATYDGRSGYVFDAYLASSQPGPRAAPARSGGGSVSPGPTEESETLYQVVGPALNFRNGPSINASRAGALSRGDTFSTSRCEVNARYEKGKSRTWCQAVSDGGLRGWVSISNDLISVLAG